MGLFFLLAGLLTAGALDRKGSRRFAGDRLLRLGVPWAASALAATLSFPLLVLSPTRSGAGRPGRRAPAA